MDAKPQLLSEDLGTLHNFALYRVILGLYLFLHFATMIPSGTLLFSSAGILPDAHLNFTYGFYPNILFLYDSPNAVTAFLACFSAISLLFAAGFYRRVLSWILIYGCACLLHRNNFTEEPGLYFTGWSLFLCGILPEGEGLSISAAKNPAWRLPTSVIRVAWIVLGFAYTVSGIDKFTHSPSWRNGLALKLVAESSYALRWPLHSLFLSLPEPCLKLIDWLSLAAEITFLPMIFNRWSRLIAWSAMVMVHTGILMILVDPDLTVQMLLFHWLVFDPKWLEPVRAMIRRVITHEAAGRAARSNANAACISAS